MIIAFCTAAATVYGILHDQITVRVCIEYFTVFHPLIFGEQSPTMLALLWGTAATWWIGAFLGTLLSIAACAGKNRMREFRSLVRPVITLLLVMASCAGLSGTVGWMLAEHGKIELPSEFASRLDPTKHSRLLADACAHDASYLIGLLGGSILIINVWKSRTPEA
jgi:hypothetical protein